MNPGMPADQEQVRNIHEIIKTSPEFRLYVAVALSKLSVRLLLDELRIAWTRERLFSATASVGSISFYPADVKQIRLDRKTLAELHLPYTQLDEVPLQSNRDDLAIRPPSAGSVMFRSAHSG